MNPPSFILASCYAGRRSRPAHWGFPPLRGFAPQTPKALTGDFVAFAPQTPQCYAPATIIACAAAGRPAGLAGPHRARRPTCASPGGASWSAARAGARGGRGGGGGRRRAGAARPGQRAHPPLQRAGPRHAAAVARRRATSWRSWSGCGGGWTARSTRSRSTSPPWWAASRPRSRAPRCWSTTTRRRRSSAARWPRSSAPWRRWACARLLCYEVTDRNGSGGPRGRPGRERGVPGRSASAA